MSVHQYRARATLRLAAAELRTVQLEIVTQYVKQRRLRSDIQTVLLAIDRDRNGHLASPDFPWLDHLLS
ncbi:hypothetical protein ACFSHT_03810 [Paraburkholderia silviterrae]|uniref:hypothetical protein n=1 Tax=Paraburkholderia silviterrae TaxID=2528715 RepID=UPI0030B8CF7A